MRAVAHKTVIQTEYTYMYNQIFTYSIKSSTNDVPACSYSTKTSKVFHRTNCLNLEIALSIHVLAIYKEGKSQTGYMNILNFIDVYIER